LRVLITGGSGFIGSHLSDALIARGDDVVVLDDLSTGSIDNVRHLLDHPRFRMVVDTVHNEQIVQRLTDECDAVFHLAAAVGVKLIIESPVRTIETNVKGTEIVLAAAARQRKRVLMASTSEVYGLSEQVPFREDGNLVMGATTKGRWSYACSKAIDEFLALAYFREKKVPAVIVRLFNTVGPRQTGRYGMVVPTLVGQALAGEPLTVFGSGKQSRCFGYVGDIVDALIKLIEHPAAPGEVFNLGSTEEVSITQLAQRIVALTGSTSKLVYVPYSEAYEEGFEDMPRRVPDTSKAERVIGFRARMPLDGILRAVIRDVAQRRGAAVDSGADAERQMAFAVPPA
jgi:UDP-glucose 4-epimerase